MHNLRMTLWVFLDAFAGRQVSDLTPSIVQYIAGAERLVALGLVSMVLLLASVAFVL